MPAARLSNIYARTSAGRIICLLFFTALIIRCLSLDLKLFHHDEAIHAWFAYNLINTGNYLYDPAYHGPLLYYLTGGAFLLLGDSDVIARLLPALFGAAIIPLFWVLNREGWMSKNHAVMGALFVAVSPSMVYFSRFLRHDVFQLFFTVALFVMLLLYFDTGRWKYTLGIGVAAACGLCLKEDMPLTLAIFGSFIVWMLAAGRLQLPKRWIRDLFSGVLIIGVIGTLFYSSFLSHPEMLFLAPGKAIAHWFGVQGECRICGAPWYYLFLLIIYELPILIFAIVGVWWYGIKENGFSEIRTGILRYAHFVQKGTGIVEQYRGIPNKHHFFVLFALYWAILSGFCYAAIGEKVPWLLIHQLFPLILLAAYGLQGKKVLLVGLGLAVIFLIGMTGHVCFTPGDLNEPIVQTQNSEDLIPVMDLIASSSMSVVTTDAYWPFPWYFRGEDWKKIVLLSQKPAASLILQKDPDVVIMLDTNSYDSASLPGYQKKQYQYNYSFSLPLVESQFPKWYLTREGDKLNSTLDVFYKNSPRASVSSLSTA